MNAEETRPVTTEDVARHFDVAVSTVRRWVREGRVPFIRPSRRVVRFHLHEVEASLAGGKAVRS